MSGQMLVRTTKGIALILVLSVAVASPALAEVYLALRQGHVAKVEREATVGDVRIVVDSRTLPFARQPQCEAGAARPQTVVRPHASGERQTTTSPGEAHGQRGKSKE